LIELCTCYSVAVRNGLQRRAIVLV
jgi:hypothetical protein